MYPVVGSKKIPETSVSAGFAYFFLGGSSAIGERLTFDNTIWFRYKNETLIETNPNLEVFFTTGIGLKF